MFRAILINSFRYMYKLHLLAIYIIKTNGTETTCNGHDGSGQHTKETQFGIPKWESLFSIIVIREFACASKQTI